MLQWLIGIILGKIICESSNWQHIQRLKITILGANWQLFRLERIAKYSYFILSTQNIKFYWFVMKKKKLCCQFDDTLEVYFLLGINLWGLCSEWVKEPQKAFQWKRAGRRPHNTRMNAITATYCPNLTKGSKWQITQFWESDVFRNGLGIFYFHSEFGTETLILLKDIYLSQDIMILHWCQCTWQTYFANLREMSFSRVAPFCHCTAAQTP